MLNVDIDGVTATITKEIFKDPNEILRKALEGQQIESFVTFELTTQANNEFTRMANATLVFNEKGKRVKPDKAPTSPLPDDKFVGGGTANIGFLQGTDDPLESVGGDSGNAHAAKMTVKYWIETIASTLTVKPKSSEMQTFRMISKAGVLGPRFTISAAASAKLTNVVTVHSLIHTFIRSRKDCSNIQNLPVQGCTW